MDLEEGAIGIFGIDVVDHLRCGGEPLGNHLSLPLPLSLGDRHRHAEVGIEEDVAGGFADRFRTCLSELHRGPDRGVEVLDGGFVVRRAAFDIDPPEHPFDLGRSHPFETGHDLDGEHALSGLVMASQRHQHAGILETGPDILGVEFLGDRSQRQGLLPLPLFAEEGQKHAAGAEVLGVEFDGKLQVDDRQVGVGFDLPFGAEHEGLGVERLDHHRQSRARAGFQAEDQTTLRVNLADRHARFVEDRDRIEIADLEERRQFIHRQRIGELDSDRVDDVAVERCLGPLQRPFLEGPGVALGAILADECLTEPELRLHLCPQLIAGRLPGADPVECHRVDGERRFAAGIGKRRALEHSLRPGGGYRGQGGQGRLRSSLGGKGGGRLG